ncbi:MAG: beta-glucosidase [Propionibacteriales bacterium]|nr:beta-glucosidase [Propionibacteriales bacterium]
MTDLQTRTTPGLDLAPIDLAAFPPNFAWGASTAAYQIEGAVSADGRTPSIWDTFSHLPGRVRDGDTGDIAADHYHRWEEDLDLVQQLGLPTYRFSLSWSRVQPTGRGPANQRGLDFYRRLVDGMLERGITPWLTLYHWDLPQELEDAGGWPARETAQRFADYAGLVVDALGDRVDDWTTLNEPWCSAFLGYGNGRHAPGRQDPAASLGAAHHLLLGHGLATQALRARGAERIGVTLNLYAVTPESERPGDREAARRVDGLHNRWFLDPLFRGSYPDDVRTDVGDLFSAEQPGDAHIIATPIDLLGVNYYTRLVTTATAYPGSATVGFGDLGLPRTSMGWEVDGSGLTEVLGRVGRDYTQIPLYVTENGAAFEDRVGPDGTVHDAARTEYIADHIAACAAARRDGVNLQGYFVWSLLDNFEWGQGYAKRFGLVYVDYGTQERIVKTSGRWFADLIRRHRGGLL